MRTSIFGFLLINCCLLFSAHERKYEGIANNNNEGLSARLEIIDQFLPKNPTVFEVGAMNGEDSVKLAAKWPEGTIISFEANPNQFKFYQERAKLHPNMYGYNLAVNTYNGFATFYVCWGTDGKDPVFEGASSLLEPSPSMKPHYMGPKIEVPCVIFDDWCAENGISNIDFVWLDLEGFELQLLKSSPTIFNTVKVIYTETNLFDFRKGITKYPALKKYLEEIGFEMIAHWYNEGLQGDAIFVRK